ncbi:MAG: SAM-dependent DNA methyltransferase [Pseudorhizobium pelagicum]|uniref:Eco57I restriction-modification methylase domain-containing protein n=1 Tax=Pseudorhizobium pelagicum TaxID=1509405 RepID=UPI00345F36EB
MIDNDDFFEWASLTEERFDCAAGNPPFIRFQKFGGSSKKAAISICEAHGLKLGGLSSAWAAFLVVTATLLKTGGRMAFVVPAEIGHAPYAKVVLQFLTENFAHLHVVAVREKIFSKLSEDCWLLYCDGYGGKSDGINITRLDRFDFHIEPPPIHEYITWKDLNRDWQGRLRPLLLPPVARDVYLRAGNAEGSRRLGDFARINIGYISGDNDFFHLNELDARKLGLPLEYLVPTVRKGSFLGKEVIDEAEIRRWIKDESRTLLLALPSNVELPETVTDYLNSPGGLRARGRFKCRTRKAWYSVPGVVAPCYFLQYMSGKEVRLARNEAGATCTNSVLAVSVVDHEEASRCLPLWKSAFVRLSCELEGHPLGGGMLKLEPGEARNVVFPGCPLSASEEVTVLSALETIREWRHVRSFGPSASDPIVSEQFI